LRRLERSLPDPGCLACCHRRGRIVMVDCQLQRDGSITALEALPVPCSACGRIAESILRIVKPWTERRTTDVFESWTKDPDNGAHYSAAERGGLLCGPAGVWRSVAGAWRLLRRSSAAPWKWKSNARPGGTGPWSDYSAHSPNSSTKPWPHSLKAKPGKG